MKITLQVIKTTSNVFDMKKEKENTPGDMRRAAAAMFGFHQGYFN